MLLLLSSWFDKTGIRSVICQRNTPFCVMTKDLSIFIKSYVLIIQNFKTVILNVLLAYKATFSVITY